MCPRSPALTVCHPEYRSDRVYPSGDVYSYPTAVPEPSQTEPRRRSYGSSQEPTSNGGSPPTGAGAGAGAGAGDEEHQLYQNYNQVRSSV